MGGHAEDHTDFAGAWLAAVGRAEVSTALEGVFAEVGRAVAARGPVCWASGRCCNFERSGHSLFVTGLEAAYTVSRLSAPLLEPEIDRALARGGCPFQVGNLCGVHAIKPIACRVYFCDRSAQAWQQDLSERLQRDVRSLHDRFGVAYRYAEWRGLLRAVVRAGGAVSP